MIIEESVAIGVLIDLVELFDSKQGINDHFNKVKNRMEPSEDIQRIIANARRLIPEKMKPAEAARAMEVIENRDDLINSSPNVVNMRAEFSKRVALNAGARGILAALVTDPQSEENWTMAQTFINAEIGEETFGEK